MPYVVSPHGTMTRWALHYKWWKKLPAMLLYQYRDLRHAKGFHVTVEAEVADVRRLRLIQPVAVAPLGVAVQSEQSKDTQHKDILFLGRIHPVKNLDGLLKAWQQIPAERRQGWRMVIAGPDDIGYQAELKSLAVGMGLRVCDFSKELEFGKKQIHGGAEVPLDVYQQKLASSHTDVIFTGPVYSESKDWLYRQSRFFVLPSHSENFGSVILEALAAGTPCLASRGTPWRQLEEHQCGWWMDDSDDDIAMALGHAMSMGEADYVGMCKRARQFVEEHYPWNMTAQKLNQLYSHV